MQALQFRSPRIPNLRTCQCVPQRHHSVWRLKKGPKFVIPRNVRDDVVEIEIGANFVEFLEGPYLRRVGVEVGHLGSAGIHARGITGTFG